MSIWVPVKSYGFFNGPIASATRGTILLIFLGAPVLDSANFKDLHQQGVIDQKGQVELGKTVKLQCSVSGNPKPDVMWIQKTSDGKIRNTTDLCQEKDKTVQSETPPAAVGQNWVRANITVVMRFIPVRFRLHGLPEHIVEVLSTVADNEN